MSSHQKKLYQAKNFLLTYPHSSFENQDLVDFLRNLWPDCSYVVASKEKHADGSDHHHALVRYGSRKSVYQQDKFDFRDRHPNVQVARSVAAAEKYVKKDGVFCEWKQDGFSEDIYDLANELGRAAYFAKCLELKVPYQYAREAWDHKDDIDESSSITFYSDPNVDLALTWPKQLSMSLSLFSNILVSYRLQTNLTNVIVGQAGCGKTVWALRHCPKPLLLVSHVDQLKHLSGSHRGIVFDDVSFLHLPRECQIQLVDRFLPRAVHRRYGTTLIPIGVTVVLTCNQWPILWTYGPIRRRINPVHCDGPLVE